VPYAPEATADPGMLVPLLIYVRFAHLCSAYTSRSG
jgi:hypothetical protein